MKQFWYTDNLKGRGLSVLRSSKGLTGDFLAAIDAYCGYLRSSDGYNGDGQRYNRSFAGEGVPVLMNSAYIGKEVTTQRNGNFLTHAVLSGGPLNGYAVDYFLKEGFFCRALSNGEAEDLDPTKSLGEIGDSGVRATEAEKKEDLAWAAEIVNRNLTFYRNLLQATLFTLKNGGHIRLFGFGDAKGDGQPICIVRALTHLFPVNLANRITFNTRANYYEPPRDRYMRVIAGKEERRATFGSVEILQFYDATRTACGTQGCNYFFYRNNEAAGVRFAKFLPFVEELLPAEGTSAALIEKFHRWFYQNNLDAEENTTKAIAIVTAEDWALSLGIPMETGAKSKARPRRPRKEKREGGEDKKRKEVIISVLLALLFFIAAGLTAVFLSTGTRSPGSSVDPPPQGQTDPPSVTEQYFTVVYPDGEAARFRIGDEVILNLPDARLGYDFLGYRDGQGKAVTDASGTIRSDYVPATDSRLELFAAWQARENKLTVSYGTQACDFTCATDAAITFPADLFPALLAAYPHRRITGFALDNAEGTKICTLSGTAVTWAEGYGVFSEEKYRSRLESGTPLVLVPLTEYLSYPVRFYDYVTKTALGSDEIVYDQPITVDVSYTADYFGGKYSLYLKKGTEFVKVYNEEGNGRWTEGYDRVSGYDEVLDVDGEIALYVAGNVRLRIGGNIMDVELGSDIFSLCEGQTKNEAIHAVNFIYVGQTRSESADSNDAFWQIIRGQDMKLAINVTPAYKATFTFGYNTDRTELAQGGNTLKRSVAYLYFTSGEYRYEGAKMSEIAAALKDKASDVHTPNGVVCADLIQNLWMPTPAETDASYAVFEGYVLEKGARMTSYFNVDGEYGGGTAALVADGSARCLYAVYDPKEVTVSFRGAVAPYKTEYGGKIDWAELNSRISGYQPQWGTYLIEWSTADGKMKESGENAVTRDFLDVYAKNDSENGAPLIEFTPKLGNYTFKFSISYGGRTDSSQSLTVGGTVRFDKTAIEAYYPVARYSTLWNQGWTLGDKNFTPAETMTLNEGNFGNYVDFERVANHVVMLTVTKGAPTPRTYTIVTDPYAYVLTERSGRVLTEALSHRLGISAAGSITYQGSMSLGVCEQFESGFFDRTQYVFEGWFVGDTRITDADGVIKNFDALYQLAQNDVITVRAVFKEA